MAKKVKNREFSSFFSAGFEFGGQKNFKNSYSQKQLRYLKKFSGKHVIFCDQ